MKIFARSLLAAFCTAALHGCKPPPIDLDQLQSSIEQVRNDNARLSRELEEQNRELAFQREKAETLEKEKTGYQNELQTTRDSMRSMVLTLQKANQSRSNELMDCFYGNTPSQRGKTTQEAKPLLLVDSQNLVSKEGATLMGGECFTQNSAYVRFCVLRKIGPDGKYAIVFVSDNYLSKGGAPQQFFFPRDQFFPLKKNDLPAIFLAPGGRLYYDDKGTGQTTIIRSLSEAKKTNLKFIPVSQKDGHAYSFRIFGSSYLD